MLNDAQVERYSRQIILPEIGGRGQKRLLAAAVAIVARDPKYLLEYLVAAGVGHITVVSRAGTAAIDDLADLNRDCRIEVPAMPASYGEWLAAAQPDAVLLQTDSDGESTELNSVCVRAGKPFLWGRTAGAKAYMALFDPTMVRGCYACTDVRRRVTPAESNILHPLAASLLASLQAAETVKLLLDRSSALHGEGLVIDAATASIDRLPFETASACSDCGGRSPS
jgi:adenylyltransferase/sulfurtransferase